jgi:hypothetical protein
MRARKQAKVKKKISFACLLALYKLMATKTSTSAFVVSQSFRSSFFIIQN